MAALAFFVLGSCLFRPSTHNTTAVVHETLGNLDEIHAGSVLVSLRVARGSRLTSVDVKGSFSLDTTGPYPVFDVELTRTVGAHSVTGTFVSTGAHVYSEKGSVVGGKALNGLRALASSTGGLTKLHIDRWITGKKDTVAGGTVGGVDTDEVQADLDVVQALADVRADMRALDVPQMAAIPQLDASTETALRRSVKVSKIAISTGKSDRILRKVVLDVGFQESPSAVLPPWTPFADTTIHFELAITDLNRHVSVRAPSGAAP